MSVTEQLAAVAAADVAMSTELIDFKHAHSIMRQRVEIISRANDTELMTAALTAVYSLESLIQIAERRAKK